MSILYRTAVLVMLSTFFWFSLAFGQQEGPSLTSEERAYLDSHQPVIFISQSNYPPFEFRNQTHNLDGMTIELAHWLETELDFRAEFTNTSFLQAQNAVLTGHADVLTSLFYSQKRDQAFDFTEVLFEVPASIFVSSERPDIVTLADLSGKRIAIQRGDYAKEFLEEQGIEFQHIPTLDFAEATDAVIQGRADAIIGDEQIVLYYLFSHGLTDQVKKVGEPLYVGMNCMAVKDGNQVLLSILNKGIAFAKQRGVLDRINQKWIGTHFVEPEDYWFRYWPYLAAFAALVLMVIISNVYLRRAVKLKTRAFQESEQRLRRIFDELSIGMAVWNEKGEFLKINQAFTEITGYSAEEISQLNFSDITSAEFHNQEARLFKDLIEGVTPNFKIEKQCIHKDGSLYWVSVNANKLHGAEESAPLFIGSLENIDQEKRLAMQIKEREETISLLLNSTAEAIYGLDSFGNCTFCNQSCLDILGYRSDQELLGRNMHEVIHHTTAEGLPNPVGDCQIFKSFKHGEKIHIESDHLWKADGTSFPAEVWSHPIQKDDAIIGAVVTFIDITKQKQSEEELKQSHNLLSKLARLVPGVIYQYRLFPDGSSAFPYSSPGMNDIYEVSPEEVQEDATPVFGRLHPDDYDMVANLIQVSAQTLKAFHCEFRVILPRQGLRWRWSQAHPERLDDGSTLWHGIISDITERKQSEYEKEQLQVQLSQVQKIESIGQLAGGVAHDFNNMLGVIIGHTEMALMKASPSNPFISDLQEISNAAKRSADLTRQLLTFARKQIIAPKVLDLNETVGGTLKMLQRLIGENIQLSWNPAADIWPVKVDPSQIDQILANLCVNSRDAISGTGKISIKTENRTLDESSISSLPYAVVPGDYVLLSVTDDGCGMDKEVQAHIFEPFYTTKKVGSGTGLGLATVYGAVKQNHGFITFHSEAELGTTFKIYLPRCVAEAVVDQEETVHKVQMGQGETVMLVEDEAAIMKLTNTILEDLGYRVLPANSPQEAIALAEGHPGEIQLLLTDVVMPNINGRDLAKQIKNMHPNLEVLYMSGYTADVIANHGVLEEGVNFIQKPFVPRDLSIRLREILDTNS